METGKLIKDLRIKKGMTQEELAEKTEVSSRTIQRIENGEVDPRAYTLQMIAKALEVDFEMFIEQESEEMDEIQKVTNNNWLGLLHLSGVIPLIFPTLIIWNKKKDEIKGISTHYRAVIGLQLMICAVALACLWVYWKVNQPIPFFGVLLVNALISITNTVRVVSGEHYLKMPFLKHDD